MRLECRPISEAEEKIIHAGLDKHTADCAAPPPTKKPFGLVLFDGDKMIGGLKGYSQWQWMYIELLWIDKAHRGQGHARDLLQKAEDWAKAEKLTGLFLITEEWEGPNFYPKLGFEEYGRIEDFPSGYTRRWFRKYINGWRAL